MTLKGALPVTELMTKPPFRSQLEKTLGESTNKGMFCAMGHARLTTNGTQLVNVNNQPIVKDGLLAVHNGIIVNAEENWDQHPDLDRQFDIDTEILLSLIRKRLNGRGSLIPSIDASLSDMFGTVSTCLLFEDHDTMVLTTNNGSLYTVTDGSSYVCFASEFHILKQLLDQSPVLSGQTEADIRQLPPDWYVCIGLDTFDMVRAPLVEAGNTELRRSPGEYFSIAEIEVEGREGDADMLADIQAIISDPGRSLLESLLEDNQSAVDSLKRCTRCVLPASFPFIEFDDSGVCNFCLNHRPKPRPNDLSELRDLVAPYRRSDGSPDCVVPFSGGRDSTYTLHLVKEELGLNPIAFTYDWGMVTDLGRRNIARVCGRLGVENIIVSADIRKKRRNIRNNVAAWLRRPNLGMIPLFMAGDKYFFYHTAQVKKQLGIDLNIWGINPLENTEFKTGFCGIEPFWDKERIYSLRKSAQVKLFGFVIGQTLLNPSYINSSIADTMGSFATRYLEKKSDYFHMFDYYQWDEREIDDLIVNTYEWELATDTSTTWRIGDGTAAFYNYIYFNVAGFSEYDTFRSNQIREGVMTREAALAKIREENAARYESIRWYLDVIGLDFKPVIETINKIPKLYRA